MIRFIGGSHTYKDIDVPAILERLKPILKDETWRDVHRLFTKGAPVKVNVQDTKANHQAVWNFGNHQAVEDHKEITKKALIKTKSTSTDAHNG